MNCEEDGEAVAIGIDLAWSPRNGTGVAAARVRDGEVLITAVDVLRTTEDIVEFVGVHRRAGRPTTVAIDAPTIVPNRTGTRPCDRMLQKRFARYWAGPYPANRSRLGAYNNGIPRGEEISRALQRRLGAVECGVPAVNHRGTAILEVFPSPAQVVLFGLARALPYKKKSRRTWDDCRRALAEYVRCLRALTDPALVLPEGIVVTDQRGRGFKDCEDKVDAAMCAYIAALASLDAARVEMVGTLDEGYVVIPAA